MILNNNNKITLYYAVQILVETKNLELEEDLKDCPNFWDEDASLEKDGLPVNGRVWLDSK